MSLAVRAVVPFLVIDLTPIELMLRVTPLVLVAAAINLNSLSSS
jgi:hypothetical protein